MNLFARTFSMLLPLLMLGSATLHASTDMAAVHDSATPSAEATAPAADGGDSDPSAEHAEHNGHHAWVVGAKTTLLNSIVEGHVVDSPAGLGLFGETTVIPGWLEVEFAAKLLDGSHALQLPIDLLVKLPLAINPTVQPFVGAGPTLVLAIPHAEAPAKHVSEADSHSEASSSHASAETNALAVHPGLATVLGSYFWIRPDVGAVVELNYNMIFEEHLAHELGGAVGLVVGF